jgi:hypothetical protein
LPSQVRPHFVGFNGCVAIVTPHGCLHRWLAVEFIRQVECTLTRVYCCLVCLLDH